MKREFPSNEALDTLTSLLIKAGNKSDDVSPSPFFMTRLRASIEERRRSENPWTLNILATSRWLLTLSAIALVFFVGSLWAITTDVPPKAGIVATDENDVVDNLLEESVAFADDRR